MSIIALTDLIAKNNTSLFSLTRTRKYDLATLVTIQSNIMWRKQLGKITRNVGCSLILEKTPQQTS